MNETSLSSLNRAKENLMQALNYTQRAKDGADQGLFTTLRGGTIQAFESAYELAVYLTRRILAEYETTQMGTAGMSFAELWRMAAEKGVTENPKVWTAFRQMRNLTSHTYDEQKAQKVYENIPEFLTELTKLVPALERLKHAASG